MKVRIPGSFFIEYGRGLEFAMDFGRRGFCSYLETAVSIALYEAHQKC